LSGAPDEEVEAAILALVEARGPGRSVCPSEVARALAPDEASWRALMPEVRAAAGRLRGRGLVRVTRRGRPADPCAARGPIRLSLGSRPPSG
jgi:hypothetical protein